MKKQIEEISKNVKQKGKGTVRGEKTQEKWRTALGFPSI